MQRGHRSTDRRTDGQTDRQTDPRTNNFVSILSTGNDNGGGPDTTAAAGEIWGGFWVSARPSVNPTAPSVRPAALRTEVSSFTLSQEFDFRVV